MRTDTGHKTPLRLPRVSCFPLLGIFLLTGIPLAILTFTEVEPAVRPIFPFDESLLNANKTSTVATIAFLVPGFVFSFIVLAVTEFILMHPQLPRQLQIDNYTQALVHLITGFLAHICIQQVSTVLAGKPRPNFLSVCKPNIAALSSTDAAGGTVTSADSITVDDCTDDRDMSDYLRSFPSGHASSSMFLAMYPVIYLLYTRLVRQDAGSRSKESRFMWEIRMGFMACFNVLVFALAWYVGLSRYIDNKHHIEDIIGGCLLGLVFAVWTVVECFIAQRAIAVRYNADLRATLCNNSGEMQGLDDPTVSFGMPQHRA